MTIDEALTAIAALLSDDKAVQAVRHLREHVCRELGVPFHDSIDTKLAPTKRKGS